MRTKSIWNDTFTVEYSYLESDSSHFSLSQTKQYTETYIGSLKTLHRKVLNERRHGHASVNFYNSDGEWLKEIMY